MICPRIPYDPPMQSTISTMHIVALLILESMWAMLLILSFEEKKEEWTVMGTET